MFPSPAHCNRMGFSFYIKSLPPIYHPSFGRLSRWFLLNIQLQSKPGRSTFTEGRVADLIIVLLVIQSLCGNDPMAVW